MQSLRNKQPGPRKREEHLSTDGKWRSFPKVPHLLGYVISRNNFGKVKINGKKIEAGACTLFVQVNLPHRLLHSRNLVVGEFGKLPLPLGGGENPLVLDAKTDEKVDQPVGHIHNPL